MSMQIDKNCIVGVLMHTNCTNEHITDMSILEHKNIISICLYRNCIGIRLMDDMDTRVSISLTPMIIKEIYEISNEQIRIKIQGICRKGIYKEVFTDEQEWYIGVMLGGRG